MSVLQFSENMNSSADVQIWNNAAFDNGESQDLTGSRQSWGSLKSVFGNPKASFDSVSGKENEGPPLENQISSSIKSSITPFKPVNKDLGVEKSIKKGVSVKGFDENLGLKKKEIRDEKKIDEEIQEIESEISRLGSRLEALRLEKLEKSLKTVEKRGKAVPAKFMEPKSNVKNEYEKKKIEDLVTVKPKVQRRGLSLGPAEILSGGRRGMSMGPSEIFGASSKSKQLGKQDMVTPSQSRRKSCFWKLQQIDEEKVTKEMGKSSSLSPKSRKIPGKTQFSSRQAVTTISSRKAVKKEDKVINSVQPKKLFRDVEKSVPVSNKKQLRPGRVVASRYNQNFNQGSEMRKRSLPENDDNDGKRCDKKRSLSVGKSRPNVVEGKNPDSEIRVKKRWEIPNEIVVHSSLRGENSPQPVVVVPDLLPRIRIGRCANVTPRDSGPAKRVAELIGRKSFFSNDDDDDEALVCQALTYAEEEGVEMSG